MTHSPTMAPWGWIAAAYGVLLVLTAIGLTGVPRRPVAIAGSAAYACTAIGAATLSSVWIHLFVPAVLLLSGYWLSGLFFRDPQPWLEDWLQRTDHTVFSSLRLDRALRTAPRWILESLEASYTADYIVVAIGALIAVSRGVDVVSRYWTIVLAAELMCYAALPFLRSRPPRALEAPGVMAQRAPTLRWLNTVILDRASVQANTIPSGHVAGAVAAALAVMPINSMAGWLLLAMALAIAASAIAGRYHYAVDCLLGAVVAVAVATAVMR